MEQLRTVDQAVLASLPWLPRDYIEWVRTFGFGALGAASYQLYSAPVMEALAGRGIRYKQVVSPGSSCTLQAEDLTDSFHDAASYKSAIAPIAEGAIDLDSLKPEQKVFSDYLGKAAEIVRREPYCQEIQLVNFSGREAPGSHR